MSKENLFQAMNLNTEAMDHFMSFLKPKTPNGHACTMNINGYEFDAIIDYTFINKEIGAREGGLQLEPDHPAHIEIDCVYILDGKNWQIVEIPEQALEDDIEEILATHLF
ncbi:MAG: hypothetical protein ACUZ8H_03845 [Candidatus Anammoxibacter sp.]